ncbi:ModD protein [Thermogladius sp. 4427co]|uniref:ModD protein n=1 Tax=Thermogladius sp. 4427co TaxID=3450718 RepID=UPI003F7A1E2D
MPSEIELLVREDLHHIDLVSVYLGVGGKGVAELVSRSRGVLACSEEAASVYSFLGASVELLAESGDLVEPGRVVLRAVGEAPRLLKAWRIAQVIVSYMSGVATYTRRMVDEARKVNPSIVIATTRQTPPGLRKLWFKAVVVGGGIVHRQGLSDEILVFKPHLVFSTYNSIGEAVSALKSVVGYKQVGVEVGSLEEALEAVGKGAEYIQFDRVEPGVLGEWVRVLKSKSPKVRIGIGGGITLENVAAYAATGVDVIVTSAPYRASPLDFTTVFRKTV